jgi:hypothetical protein
MKLTLLEFSNYSSTNSWEVIGEYKVLYSLDKTKEYANGTNTFCKNIKTTIAFKDAAVITSQKPRLKNEMMKVEIYKNDKFVKRNFFSKKEQAINWAKDNI